MSEIPTYAKSYIGSNEDSDESLMYSSKKNHSFVSNNSGQVFLTPPTRIGESMSDKSSGKILTVVGDISASANLYASHSVIGAPNNNKAEAVTAAGSASLSVTGDISGSGNFYNTGNVYAKTFKSEPIFTFTNATAGEEYYFAIGGNPFNDTISSAVIYPAPALVHTAMCNTSIKKIKMQFLAPTTGTTNFKIYCRKWDNSGALIDADANWDNVGTVWTVKSGDISDNERFYHAPSDWDISAGEIWGLQFEMNGGGGTVYFGGGVMIEEDWNNQVSS